MALLIHEKDTGMSTGKEFKVGDIVKLKSGGPEMTVKNWSDYHKHYVCQWFAGKKLEQGEFKADSLKLVEIDSGQS
nr:DUF2158 domain-containing protein [uncultured Pseudomonas sp.]